MRQKITVHNDDPQKVLQQISIPALDIYDAKICFCIQAARQRGFSKDDAICLWMVQISRCFLSQSVV